MTRRYNNKKRLEHAAQTNANIIYATEKLLSEKSLDEIDLNTIAKEAKTTVQTVLRHMKSREGCLEAVAQKVAERVEIQRGNTEYENIDSAISDLIDHYESEGKLVLNLLAQEHSGEYFAADITRRGRSYHRKWVKYCFNDYLSKPNNKITDALVAVTDIYTWKLLRLDMGRSRHVVKEIIAETVKKILEE